MMGMALQLFEEHDGELWKNLCEQNLGMRAREDQRKGKAQKKKKEKKEWLLVIAKQYV
jgi:hypothetical protein